MRLRTSKKSGQFIAPVAIGSLFLLASTAIPADPTPAGQRPTITDSQRTFFENKIRPALTKYCFECHSGDIKTVEGGLKLDTADGTLHGGTDGPIIVKGRPEDSLLIKAIRYTNKDLQMPPPDSSGKLPDSVINDFVSWVRMGAPDPRDAAAPVPPQYDPANAKKWWSFQPLKKPAPAQVESSGWPRTEIDKYVLAAQQNKQLKPVADADKQTLIRRLYFDLIGLPPTPQQVDAFVNDTSPEAYEKTVDQLLASPQFGEQWGRHWLDVARYAESTGKEYNVTYPNAWRYRDYVIAAFNKDKPYNQFIREQLAGDQMIAPDMKKRVEQVVATGFLAIGPKGLSETSSRQFDLDLADEQVDATSQAFLALTVSCARCHDHKFDPILQSDYYAMDGIFLSTKTYYGTVAGPRNNQDSDLIELPALAKQPTVEKPQTAAERAQLQKNLADATEEYDSLIAERGGMRRGAGRRGARRGGDVQMQQPAANDPQLFQQIRQSLGRKSQLEDLLNTFDDRGQPKAFCMGAEDRPVPNGPVGAMPALQLAPNGNPARRQASGFDTIADSPLFFRGEMSEPRDRVPRGVPVFLSARAARIGPTVSGRRELADWIANPANPLTARVMANRIWYWLFGQGIVTSVDNFGSMGDPPSDQALLDYLANQLIDNGWSVKKTIRQIVLSRTYQLACTYDESDYGIDPQNTLLWRHSKRRLSAESIRDAMLAVSGQLDLTPPLGSAVAQAGNGAIGAGPVYERIKDDLFVNLENSNRSIYLPMPRDAEPDALSVFDYPSAAVVTGARQPTNVPSQALYLLNSNFVQSQARQLAQRVLNEVPAGSAGPLVLRQQRVNLAFRLVFGRPPNEFEQNAAAKFFADMNNDLGPRPVINMTDFCLSLFNTAEFRYLN